MGAVQVGFWLEYGTSSMPPRPFFRNMISKNSPEWGKLIAVLLKRYQYKINPTLTALGMKIAEQLTQSIEEFTTPDIKQSTKNRKGFSTPLQDSRNMKRAVAFEVFDEPA